MPTSSVKRLLKVPSEEQPTAKQTSVTLRSPRGGARVDAAYQLGTAKPTPDLTDAGVADVALLLVILGTAVVHAVHLHRWRARLTRSLVPASGQQQDARDGAERHGGES